ncbi:TRAP transporter small permease subunit [Paracoccus pacificus]|uniref:TRAP transporter small permease protein n=1 Tax=Paracoccus pacificus TaxID=1463598 RepID=A0ABW4R739_9RHOB
MTRLASWVAVIGLSALLAVTGLTILEIVLRSGPVNNLRAGWPGLDDGLRTAGMDGLSDIYGPLAIIAVAACFPAMLANRAAITVRFVADALPWRLREALRLLGDLSLLAMFGLMAWWVSLYTLDLWRSGETTWLIELPRWPAWAVASGCLWISVLVQCGIIAEQAARSFAASEPPPLVIETVE